MRKLASLGSFALLFVTSSWAQDEETRKHVLHELGSPFIVSRAKVQKELKLSDDQKKKLQEKYPEYVQETMKVFETLKDLNAGEREKEMQSHRKKSGEKFEPFLRESLTVEQFKRFQQLELQHEGPASLLRPDLVKALKITTDQRQQFIPVLLDMQEKIQLLLKEAQAGGNPQEIRSRVVKIREDHEGEIEALMGDAQKKQWKEMLGKPVDVLDPD